MERVTVWDEMMTPAERGALSPGLPDGVDRTPDVLVVGGGVIGLATAVFLRRRGVRRVVLVERAPRLAPGASSGNAGMVAPDMHLLSDPPEFVAFGRRSRELYLDLEADWDGGVGLRRTRWLDIRSELPARLPAPLRVVGEDELRAIEPDVRLPEGACAVLVEGQLAVHPATLTAALARRAGQVVTGVGLLGVSQRGDRVAVAHTTAGDFAPGAIVVATGLVPRPWHAGVVQRWVKGHMLAVAPGPWRLGSVLAGGYGGGSPLPGGGVVCGGTFDEDDDTPEVRPEVADPMAKALATLVPGAAEARISHRWCCFRPWIEGRQPVVDRLPGLSNGWFAGGHFTTGMMMAPATGAAVADWIVGGAAPAEVAGFSMPGQGVVVPGQGVRSM